MGQVLCVGRSSIILCTRTNYAPTTAQVISKASSGNGDVEFELTEEPLIDEIISRIYYATETAKFDLESKVRLLELGENLNLLEEAYRYYRDPTKAKPKDGLKQVNRLINLGKISYFKYERHGSMVKLNDAIENFQQALLIVGSDNSSRQDWLQSLAGMYKDRYDRTEQLQHLQEAIRAYQELVDKADRCSIDILVSLCYIKCQKTEALQDINQAISSGQTYVKQIGSKIPPYFPQEVAARVIDLSKALQLRYRSTRNVVDLEEALSLCQQAIKLTDLPYLFNIMRPAYIDMMSKMLIFRGNETGEARDIERAVSYCEELRNQVPQGDTPVHRDIRAIYFRNHSRALMLKYENVSENIFDLEQAITICQQALENTYDSVLKAEQHYYLSRMLLHKHKATESDIEIEAAKFHAQQAVDLIPAGHPDKQTYVENLVHIQCSKVRSVAKLISHPSVDSTLPVSPDPISKDEGEATKAEQCTAETPSTVKDFETSQPVPEMDDNSLGTSPPRASLSTTAKSQTQDTKVFKD